MTTIRKALEDAAEEARQRQNRDAGATGKQIGFLTKLFLERAWDGDQVQDYLETRFDGALNTADGGNLIRDLLKNRIE